MANWDRIKAAFFGAVGAADPRVAYRAAYAGTVVSQAADGSVDVKMDDPRLPGMSALPLVLPIAGTRIRLRCAADATPSPTPASVARCLVIFLDGDPARPACMLMDAPKDAVDLVTFAVTTTLELGGQGLDPLMDGVLTGRAIDPFTGLQHWQLGNASKVVLAKKEP
jgi:hypothetical protein